MTRGWTAADLPNLTGKTAVVTGASSGIGLATATHLARAGAHVVLAVRDEAKGHDVAAGITGDAGQVEVRTLDLASLTSVQAFATDWTGDLDILINNAGIMMVPAGKTQDGFELHMGTNHLGHFALTTLLLPHIKERVVTVTSELHRGGQIHLDDLNYDDRAYDALQAYRDSKLANLLFTLGLTRQLKTRASEVRAVSAHPGLARTNLTSHVGGPVGVVQRTLTRAFNGAEQGALPTLFAATQDIDPGSYVGPDGFKHLRGFPRLHEPSQLAKDTQMAEQLWELSHNLLAQNTAGDQA